MSEERPNLTPRPAPTPALRRFVNGTGDMAPFLTGKVLVVFALGMVGLILLGLGIDVVKASFRSSAPRSSAPVVEKPATAPIPPETRSEPELLLALGMAVRERFPNYYDAMHIVKPDFPQLLTTLRDQGVISSAEIRLASGRCAAFAREDRRIKASNVAFTAKPDLEEWVNGIWQAPVGEVVMCSSPFAMQTYAEVGELHVHLLAQTGIPEEPLRVLTLDSDGIASFLEFHGLDKELMNQPGELASLFIGRKIPAN